MTNREWLMNEMKNMSDEEFAKRISSTGVMCEEQSKKCLGNACVTCKLDWLKQERREKITLSEIERNILTYLPKRYNYIARDANNELYVYKAEPTKSQKSWYSDNYDETEMGIFEHLFQFVKWEDEEPYNIKELLSSEDEY